VSGAGGVNRRGWIVERFGALPFTRQRRRGGRATCVFRLPGVGLDSRRRMVCTGGLPLVRLQSS
jgi:hypothetical protein